LPTSAVILFEQAAPARRQECNFCMGDAFQHERANLRDDSEYREFVALVEAHGGALLALLRRLCRHEQDAEDAFQETAARVWRSIADRPPLRNPRGWLLTIGYRAFLDQKARVKAHEAFADSPSLQDQPPPERAIQNEEASRVHLALGRLAEPIRQVLTLHYTGGLSLRKTAEAMGVSEGTVKSRLHAGLNQIRRILE
jgi:RNA polymerase sigma-70 factor (ECF subfamily)